MTVSQPYEDGYKAWEVSRLKPAQTMCCLITLFDIPATLLIQQKEQLNGKWLSYFSLQAVKQTLKCTATDVLRQTFGFQWIARKRGTVNFKNKLYISIAIISLFQCCSLLKMTRLQLYGHETQQACALHFFLSSKVISESSEALLCKEMRVKRGKIDVQAARASHQKEVSLHACAAGRSKRLRHRLRCIKLTETIYLLLCLRWRDALLFIKPRTIRRDAPIVSPYALLCLSIICLSPTHLQT